MVLCGCLLCCCVESVLFELPVVLSWLLSAVWCCLLFVALLLVDFG